MEFKILLAFILYKIVRHLSDSRDILYRKYPLIDKDGFEIK